MSNEQILFNTCSFFASEKWWHPIISFVYSNNGAFKPECQNTLNNSEKSFTHEQYSKFIEFTNMVINIIDKILCSHLGITDKMFENILFSTYEDGNVQSHVIIDTLQKTVNFFDFKDEMTRCNSRTEELINQAIIEITTSLSNDVDVNDPENFAKKVAEMTQNKIDNEVNELVQKGCRQMRALLDIDIIKPDIPGTPQRRPLAIKSSPNRNDVNETHLSSHAKTPDRNNNRNIDNIPIPQTPPIHTSKADDNFSLNSQHKPSMFVRRNINRPPPLQSKIHLSKLSLNSSSSSDNDDDYYYSASSTPPSSPSRINSAKSAPQSPFSSSKTKYSPISPPQSPPITNANSPEKPTMHRLISLNTDDQTLDPEEVERRRQFYIKQRDILAKKEHRKPPPHSIIKPHQPIHKKMPNASPAAKQRKYYRKIDE